MTKLFNEAMIINAKTTGCLKFVKRVNKKKKSKYPYILEYLVIVRLKFIKNHVKDMHE